MITINLEQEQKLHKSINQIFEELTPEQKENIATQITMQYFLDSIDYSRQQHINDSIAEARTCGIRMNEWDKLSVEDVNKLTDKELVMDFTFRRKYLMEYKSPKENILESVNKLLKDKLEENVVKFVNENNSVKEIIKTAEDDLKIHMKDIITETISGVAFHTIIDFISDMKRNQNISGMVESIQMRLNRNNIV